MRKILLLMFVSAFWCLCANAQSNMYIYMNNGDSEETIALTDIDKITFEGANMVITPKEGSQKTIALTAIKDFKFTPNSTTSLLTLQKEAVVGPEISVKSGIIKVEGWDTSRTATLSVYSVGGQQMLSISEWKGADIDINTLPKGVYVIKIENQTTKIRK